MNDNERLKWAFEASPNFFKPLTTLRSRRVGRGYRIDSDTEIKHPITGRLMKQAGGPMKFVSKKEPQPLTKLEEALLCWAACGPSGLVAWDISLDGGFHELTWISGRTAPAPGNSHATDLLVINNDGAFIYKPTKKRDKPIEIQTEADYDKVLRRLRVKDVEFTRYEILVREGKGDKPALSPVEGDRVTMLATAVIPKLRGHLEGLRGLHAADLAAGFGRMLLPDVLARKYPDLHPCPQPRRPRCPEPRRRIPGGRIGGAIGSGMRFVSEWRGHGGVQAHAVGSPTQWHLPSAEETLRIGSAGRLGWCFPSDVEMELALSC